MKLLVVHTWLRGNLGDVLQASVLLRALRELGPATLDLAGYPARTGPAVRELLDLSDRHVPEPFGWYFRYVPEGVRKATVERVWRRRRAKLFSRYDAIISAPGPFLAEYDARWPAAVCDLELARDLEIPFILSCHSVGPLPSSALARIARASVCVARESATHAYLEQHGLASVQAADYAFLYPFSERLREAAPSRQSGRYRVLFLRSNNLDAGGVAWDGRTLVCGERRFELEPDERLVVATSDGRRDDAFVGKLSRALAVPAAGASTVADLIALIAGSSGVISDRYHPLICAKVLGKSATVLENREPHKMQGLKRLIDTHGVSELQALAQAGLTAVRGALGSARALEEPA
jgi:polysaccharide pyruvyl transferase WcaK-like protein